MTDAPRISPEQVKQFLADFRHNRRSMPDDLAAAGALAAFLRSRVPEMRIPRVPPYDNPMRGDTHEDGFNACRDQVLRGRE